MQAKIRQLVEHPYFDIIVLIFIFLNCIVIGAEISYDTSFLDSLQHLFLFIFTIELILRWVGRKSTRDYLNDKWNFLDIIVVLFGVLAYIAPVSFRVNMSVVRIVRTFRVFRTLRMLPELRLMSAVLLVSLRSLVYSGLLFLITMYVYAIIGVTLFRDPSYASSPNIKLNPTNPDPYGSLGEAFFTLFRILTGEDWTDLRYNLLNQPHVDNFTVTFYHVSWMILGAYLLVNLVVGAILNNYDRILEERKEEQRKQLES